MYMFETYRISPSLQWIIAYKNDRQQLQNLAREYNISKDSMDFIDAANFSSRITEHLNTVHITKQIPRYSNQTLQVRHIHIFVNQDHVITVLDEPMLEMEELRKRLEANPHAMNQFTSWQLAIEILARSLSQATLESQKLLEYITHLEDALGTNVGIRTVKLLASINRSCLELKRIGYEYEHVAEQIRKRSRSNHDMLTWYDAIIPSKLDTFRKSVEILNALAKELKDTHSALLSSQQNETLKLFAVISFITFPIAILVDLLTIEHTSNPLSHLNYEFWIITGTVVLLVFTMVAYFRRKGWL